MMKIKKYAFALTAMAAALLSACSKETGNPTPEPPGPKQRTFFLYVAADNSLGGKYDYANVESLTGAVTREQLQQANIVIYHDPVNDTPRLLEVVWGTNGKATTREVKPYTEQNSGSAEVFEKILDEVVTKYPADRYGLLMWSHGSGWLPGDFLSGKYNSRAIAQDNWPEGNSWIEIDEFAGAIPDGLFDYIVFDACNMAYVEVAWALREKTDYILGSVIEIMDRGMPYELMPGLLLAAEPDYEAFCDAFIDEYADTYGAAVSLLRTDGLPALAASVREILTGALPAGGTTVEGLDIDGMQHFGRRLGSARYDNAFFDLDEYMELAGTGTQHALFQEALRGVVAYQKASSEFMPQDYGLSDNYGSIPIVRHSGLGSYVPRGSLSKLNDYYVSTAWYREVYPQ